MRVNHRFVVHDEFDGEIMAVRNDTGTYYSMYGSAAVVWNAVTQGCDIDGAADVVARAYGVAVDGVRSDAKSFVADLLDEQLVIDDDRVVSGIREVPSA